MAETLLNKILHNEIPSNIVKTWLLNSSYKDPQYQQNQITCTQTDFLYQFLNCIHRILHSGEKQSHSTKKHAISQEKIYNSHAHSTPSEEKKKKMIKLMKRIKPSSSDDNIRLHEVNSKLESFSLQDLSDLNRSCSLQTSFDNCSGWTSPKLNTSNVHSTPRIMKMQSDTSMDSPSLCHSHNTSFLSPISPLYRNSNSFNTPKIKRTQHERVTPVCLGDFIVTKKVSNKKKLQKVDKHNHSERSSNSFNFKEELADGEELPRNGSDTFKNSGERCKASLYHNFSSIPQIPQQSEPSISMTTYRSEIDILVDLYVAILDNDLVPNKTGELYFLISLLLYKQQPNHDALDMGVDFLDNGHCVISKVTIDGLFKSLHNIVYFACQVLKTQTHMLKNLDRHTLKLLTNNLRLNAFVPGFVQELNLAIEGINERVLETYDGDIEIHVCFKSDTDNREYFPNDPSFHAFRKQRDLFYEILDTWILKHSLPGWDFSFALSGKIKLLFSLYNEAANFMHFARLFTAQILKSESKRVTSTLPNVDSDKMNKLINRMTVNSSDNRTAMNALPGFTGHQEFYKEFILTACSYTFNRHLYDALSSEIVNLNDSNFFGTEHPESFTDVEPSTRKSYTACIRSLRVLAKFLGFLDFLPYISLSKNYNQTVVESQLNIRQQVSPNFDVKKVLLTALEEKKLILAIPWVTEYMAMLDYVTLRTPYYLDVIETLMTIHCQFRARDVVAKTVPYNIALLKCSLGWLFELPQFPQDRYYAFVTKQKQIHPQHNGEKKMWHNGLEEKETEESLALDVLDIIDIDILYTCCPYLEEIRKLLHTTPSMTTSSSANPPMRHMNIITISTIESQLEEAFFNGQPNSVRKTVEFVSERVTSSCVKHLCHNIVPVHKKRTMQKFKYLLVSSSQEDGEDAKKRRNMLKSRSIQMASDALKDVHEVCHKEMMKIASERIPVSIKALLPVDSLEQIQETCVAITSKMCMERVKQWVNTQVTTAIFLKDMDSALHKFSPEDEKKPVFLLPPNGSNKHHNSNTTSASHLLEKIRDLLVAVLERKQQLTEETLIDLLNETKVTLTDRADVNEVILATICTLLVDLSLLLITHHSVVMSDTVLTKLAEIWKLYYTETENLFTAMLSPRNVMMFAQSSNQKGTWTMFAQFLAFLVKQKLLNCDNFQTQCIALFQRDWDKNTLGHISSFFGIFLECYKKNGGSSSTFTFIVDFLADYCNDLDF